jgi:hypothetical protein
MSSLPAERNDGWDGITSEPPKVQVKAEEPDTIEELCAKYLAAHEGLVE